MAKRIKPVIRVDPDFLEDMRRIAEIRLRKGLAELKPTEISLAEMTRLLRRTEGYQVSLRELMTKPKRRTPKRK